MQTKEKTQKIIAFIAQSRDFRHQFNNVKRAAPGQLHVINWQLRSRFSNLCLFVAYKNTPFPVEGGFPMEEDGGGAF